MIKVFCNDRELPRQKNRAVCRWQTRQGIFQFRRQAESRLERLDAATSLKDLAALPGNRLEALKGNRQDQYSIRINNQWRICFEWPNGASGPINVEIVDYH